MRFSQLSAESRMRHSDDDRCPWCGHELSEQPASDDPSESIRCPECGAPCQSPHLVLEGRLGSLTDAIIPAAGWILVVTGTLTTNMPWLSGVAGTLMVGHLGMHATRLFERQILAMLAHGVALIHGDRVTRFVRWHLFEQARLDRVGQGPSVVGGSKSPPPRDQPVTTKWRLTLLNAYKPSISTFLHSRGTDAPIFAESVQFQFAATPTDALSLQENAQTLIDSAQADYKALRLATMDYVAPRRRDLLRLRSCPRCHGPLTRHDRSQCPRCELNISKYAFAIRGMTIGASPFRLIGGMLILIAAIATWLSGLWGLALPMVAVSAGLVISWWTSGSGRAASCLMSDEGVEIWNASAGDDTPMMTYDWTELAKLATVKLESKRWRAAFWTEPKDAVRYSQAFYRWVATPGGSPAIDLVLEAEEDAGKILCGELETLWQNKRSE